MDQLGRLLKEKEGKILARWQSVLLESHPESAGRFFENKKARFQNPVGYVLEEGLRQAWLGLVEGKVLQELARALDPLIRLRATQELSPSQALAFIPRLKGILREEVSTGKEPALEAAALSWLEERIDELTLLAFEGYVHCREQIYELRVRELRLSLGGLPPRARGRTAEAPDVPDSLDALDTTKHAES